MRGKTVGIIGGFGPDSTAQFFLRLVDEHRKDHHGDQPNVIIHNVGVPRNFEENLLLRGDKTGFCPLLTRAAQALERDGADVITLPCNTLHVFEKHIRSSVRIPFISIIDATIQELQQKNIRQVGFLGSKVTIRENLFRKNTHITFHTVPSQLQRRIDRGLDLFVGNQNSEQLRKALRESFAFFHKKNIGDVLVACTDFHGLYPNTIRIHDTLDILVGATVNML